MNFSVAVRARLLAVFLVLASASGSAAIELCSKDSSGKRCVLWNIVHHCLDSSVADYCKVCPSPLEESSCAVQDACRKQLQLWGKNADFIAMRDYKMCGCLDASFVHGLVLPLWYVIGDEDPQTRVRDERFNPKLTDAWTFAWSIASHRIPFDEVVLAVNPPSRRTQDQFHIHMMRLGADARRKILALPRAQLETVADLGDVWLAVRSIADATSYSEYGIAVTRDTKTNRFVVALLKGSPEEEFGVYRCPR